MHKLAMGNHDAAYPKLRRLAESPPKRHHVSRLELGPCAGAQRNVAKLNTNDQGRVFDDRKDGLCTVHGFIAARNIEPVVDPFRPYHERVRVAERCAKAVLGAGRRERKLPP